ncbi:MAG: hypothetical protein IJ119_06270 [Clostridia bacterium]|nr:hypothetical protein [Clostridia bacterium]
MMCTVGAGGRPFCRQLLLAVLHGDLALFGVYAVDVDRLDRFFALLAVRHLVHGDIEGGHAQVARVHQRHGDIFEEGGYAVSGLVLCIVYAPEGPEQLQTQHLVAVPLHLGPGDLGRGDGNVVIPHGMRLVGACLDRIRAHRLRRDQEMILVLVGAGVIAFAQLVGQAGLGIRLEDHQVEDLVPGAGEDVVNGMHLVVQLAFQPTCQLHAAHARVRHHAVVIKAISIVFWYNYTCGAFKIVSNPRHLSYDSKK